MIYFGDMKENQQSNITGKTTMLSGRIPTPLYDKIEKKRGATSRTKWLIKFFEKHLK